MIKEKITQQDAILILLKRMPNISLDMIEGELPGYYRKNLAGVIKEMTDKKLVYWSYKHYNLTKDGEKTFSYRFAELRKKGPRKELEGLEHAFGM